MWHKAQSRDATVEVLTSWSGWTRPGIVLAATRDDGYRVTSLRVPPGEQSYAIVEDGVWLTDETVGTTAFHDGHEVTWLDQADCSEPGLRVDGVSATSDGRATISATFLASELGPALDPKSVALVDETGKNVPFSSSPADPGALSLSLSGLSPGKHVMELSASDADGKRAAPARVTAWVEARPWDWRDAIVYQVMVDRFRDQNGALAPPASPSGWAGGNVDGVRAAIESGELAKMGVNVLWLSPLYQNPDGEFPGADGRSYSAYHGYWPKDSRSLDARLATEASLSALIASAHAHDVRVLFDVVPHHVHQEHPYVSGHSDGSWFTDWGGACVCGSATCSWATHEQDCWFAPYLPSLDWTRADVADQLTADVSWWMEKNGDGLRIDAVPMMPRAAVRRIAADVRARFDHPGNVSYLLGENFTGPAGYDSLRYELGPFGLSGEFHFPLMWALRGAIAWGSSPLSDVDLAEHQGEADWQGSGAVMALMIGNHDVTRFSSESAGDAGGDGFTAAPQSTDPLVYQKQKLALGLLFSMPGAPVVYYGDEVALAGRQDPDSRRVMPAESQLTPLMQSTRDFVRKMASIRACSAALRRGAYRTLVSEGEELAFAREADDGSRAIVIAFRNGATGLDAPLPGVTAGGYVDALTGEAIAVDPSRTVVSPAPWSMRVLLPAGDACLK